MDTIRVVLVDDQVLFAKSLKTVLETYTEDIKIVGLVHNGEEAIECARSTQPDIVLLDVRMPGMDGVKAAHIIHEELPKIQVIMLTTFDDDEYVREALQYGAVGYLLKDIDPSELIASIRAVYKGSVLISPAVAAKLVKHIEHFAKHPDAPSGNSFTVPPWLDSLTKREKEVLSMLAKGYNNKEISNLLFIAEQTVRNHVSTIYSKLGIHDRIKTMQMALKASLNSGSE